MPCHIHLRSFHGLPPRLDGDADAGFPDVRRHSRPVITAEAFPGHVRINCEKAGAESFHIYMRRKGQPAFRRLAARHRSFPFVDESPLDRAGVPETREYLVMGIPANEETGQPSDVVAVVLAADFRPPASDPPRDPITVVCSTHPHHEG
jgi:hypothetical protein